MIQISRKGKSLKQAGPDFTQHDLRDLVAIGEMLAPCLALFADV